MDHIVVYFIEYLTIVLLISLIVIQYLLHLKEDLLSELIWLTVEQVVKIVHKEL